MGVAYTSCSSSDDDEPNMFAVSSNEIEFISAGGEQTISISSTEDWTHQCDADWLTVRRNHSVLRIIADENMSAADRIANVSIYASNMLKATIHVRQKALTGIDRSKEISYNAGRYSFKHAFRVPPTIISDTDWCKAVCVNDSIIINVERNYNLQDRTSTISIGYEGYSTSITVRQARSPWYESFQMVYVEGGTFDMGAQSKDPSSKNYDPEAFSVESPVHMVTLQSYYISSLEVSQEQWTEAMGENPSMSQLGGKYPVENVSWDDVQGFITKLCEVTGKKYRLPSEAQWEYASRGGKNMDPWIFSGGNTPSALGWFYSNSNSSIHEAGQKEPNSLGVYDMTGNVSEWVSDWFANYDSADTDNPLGPSTGTLKINRGGACNTSSKNCRNTYRNMNSPSEKNGYIGFRLVLEE